MYLASLQNSRSQTSRYYTIPSLSLFYMAVLLVVSQLFHIVESVPAFSFQTLQKNVNVVTSYGNVAFKITNPHPNNHQLSGTVTLFSTLGERIKDIELDFRLISHRHAPLGRDLFAKGYSCYRWDAILPDNITILEYWCRVQRNKATAGLSKLEFNMTYHLVSADVMAHTYNATSTAWFSRNRMRTTKDNITTAGLVDSTHSTTDKSLPVTSNPSTVYAFITITLLCVHWLQRLD